MKSLLSQNRTHSNSKTQQNVHICTATNPKTHIKLKKLACQLLVSTTLNLYLEQPQVLVVMLAS